MPARPESMRGHTVQVGGEGCRDLHRVQLVPPARHVVSLSAYWQGDAPATGLAWSKQRHLKDGVAVVPGVLEGLGCHPGGGVNARLNLCPESSGGGGGKGSRPGGG